MTHLVDLNTKISGYCIVDIEILVQIANLLNRIIPICGKSEAPTPTQIFELEKDLQQLSKIIDEKLQHKVDGSIRTRGLNSPKLHKLLTHTVDWLKWWGVLGMWSEQSIEVTICITKLKKYVIITIFRS